MTVKNLLCPLSEILKAKSLTDTKEDCVVGIEVENEFKNEILWPRIDHFNRVEENSLRYYGFEYVSKPLKYREYKKRIETLCHRLYNKDNLPTNSIRTSTHVHFDVTKLSFIELLTFACVYWTLEGWLTSFAGNHRAGNLFCLRLKDAFSISQYIQNILKSNNIRESGLLSNDLRYASVNFASLAKFGTLEFRLMRGTLNADEIIQWVDTLEAIRQYSLKFKTPREFRTHFLEHTNARDLPREILGQDLFDRYLPFVGEETEKVIRQSFEEAEAIMVAHAYDFAKDLAELAEAEKKAAQEAAEKAKRLYAFNSLVTPAFTNLNHEAADVAYTVDLSPGFASSYIHSYEDCV